MPASHRRRILTKYCVTDFGAQMAEIYERGPVACLIDATALHEYYGGYVITDT